MHALGGAESHQLSSPQFGEITRDAQGATLVDLMNTTGLYSLANKAPRPDTRASTQGQSVVDYTGSRASKFTTSVAHYIVDD
jgi:hypothetical protein